ncbi:hypothetical protein [Nitrobacter sp.]|uniref:hypothetical protein n=1 Tax=Nitrobacter sp. TaxID=29420 RepID=UPI0029CABD13|nr:hypothetical protein [Nitrobacter sp.]
MAELRIRIYNVIFGDAILLTIPESDGRTVTMLIDFGNALLKGGDDDALRAVGENLKRELGNDPLDLYIMTHEHMDHVQGPLLISKKFRIKAREVWMTASSAPDYYERFANARKKRLAALDAYDSIAAFAARTAAPERFQMLLALNNPRASRDCVDFIAAIGEKPAHYVHREAAIDGHHPFVETGIRLLAPEEDTSVYYGRLRPRTLGVSPNAGGSVETPSDPVVPPAGVAAGDFFDLIEFRATGMSANLRTIDKAANNSSVAIELEWRGWRLLFPGDAEEKSWEIMDRENLLRPVHFLKISHHGSRNGSPLHQIDKVFPAQPHDGRHRVCVVSTSVGAYPGVPDEESLALLRSRSTEFHDTRDLAHGKWHDVVFAAP